MITLHESIQLYVTADTDDIRQKWVDALASTISQVTGGVTVIQAQGWWVGQDVLVREPSTILQAFCKDANKLWGDISPVLAAYIEDANQEAVAVILNNEFYLLESADEIREFTP